MEDHLAVSNAAFLISIKFLIRRQKLLSWMLSLQHILIHFPLMLVKQRHVPPTDFSVEEYD